MGIMMLAGEGGSQSWPDDDVLSKQTKRERETHTITSSLGSTTKTSLLLLLAHVYLYIPSVVHRS